MINSTNKLKARFCKDKGIKIQMFTSPYFEQRLELMGYKKQYDEFLSFINTSFNTEEEFFSYYAELQQKIIDYIKQTEAYAKLSELDSKLLIPHIPQKQTDIYTENNIGKKLLSLDMRHANFSAMVTFGIVYNADFFHKCNYKAFVETFSPYKYFAESKHMREVIFGNCNPKRIIAFEKFLMGNLAEQLINAGIITQENIVSFCGDEIILQGDTEYIRQHLNLFPTLYPLKIQEFTLGKITNTKAFIKIFSDGTYELKCLDAYEAPFVYRFLNNEQPQENDCYFLFEGKLAKLIDIPSGIKINISPKK